MHIVLTGEKQVGKSTLVKALLSRATRPIRGIKSVSIFENGDRNVYLFPVIEKEPKKENGKLAGICRSHHVVEKHPENFDSYGVELLEGIPSGSFVVIDEVGNMEKDANRYNEMVLSLLERKDILLLIVVQKMASTPLSEAIRNHRNVKLMEVTEANRNLLKEKIQGI